jgi:hypothetical protein
MITLLMVVLVCGVVSWLIYSLPIPQPFKNIALAILIIICIVVFFQAVLGTGTGIHLR